SRPASADRPNTTVNASTAAIQRVLRRVIQTVVRWVIWRSPLCGWSAPGRSILLPSCRTAGSHARGSCCDTGGDMNPSYAEVERLLLGRWPETRLEPSLDRITALCDMLGNPQGSFNVVHLTGTNGKTSTSRMIDTLLRALDLRTGRFTSPHLQSMTERISIDGE